MNNKTEVSTNMAWSTILTIVFVALKVTDVIDWSWWWVVSPVLIHVALFLIAFLVLTWFAYQENKR